MLGKLPEKMSMHMGTWRTTNDPITFNLSDAELVIDYMTQMPSGKSYNFNNGYKTGWNAITTTDIPKWMPAGEVKNNFASFSTKTVFGEPPKPYYLNQGLAVKLTWNQISDEANIIANPKSKFTVVTKDRKRPSQAMDVSIKFSSLAREGSNFVAIEVPLL